MNNLMGARSKKAAYENGLRRIISAWDVQVIVTHYLYTSDVVVLEVLQMNDANGSACGQLHQYKNVFEKN